MQDLPQLPPRKPDSHKGDFGTALVVGGSRGMAGAAALAAMAALRGGAGLVRAAVPNVCLETVAGFNPCYTTIPLPCDPLGRISFAALPTINEQAEKATALAVGPGLGQSDDLRQLIYDLFVELPKPAAFDADALNALAEHGDLPKVEFGPRILTPHPGEFARLVGRKLGGDARNDAATELAVKTGSVVLLKGRRTFITDGQRHAFNETGNPGMATGGSGDVLTGLIVALLCQKMEPFEAAQLAAHLHGLAGDLAVSDLGQVSLTALDLISYLPKAFQKTEKKSGTFIGFAGYH